MNIESLFLAPIYLPLLASALLVTAKAFGQASKVAESLAFLIGLMLPAVCLALLTPAVIAHQSVETVIGAWETNLGIHYHFDGLCWLLIALHLAVSIPVFLYSKSNPSNRETFSIIFFIQCASVAATSLTADLFNLFVCLEVMGVTSYVLIASSDEDGSVLASFTYLLFSATAMVFFLIGAFGLYRVTGSLSYALIAEVKNSLSGNDLIVAQLSLVLIVVSTLLRCAVVPLSGWLVGAHSKAQHAVSALLSGVLIKIPLFALIRLLLLVTSSERIGSILAWAGGISAVAGILLALREVQAKRLLAYSSVSQIGYVVAAYGLAIEAGLESERGALLIASSLFYAFCHAIAKALLFLSVGTATDALGTKDLRKGRSAAAYLKASGERVPIITISYGIALFSISALPPTLGFWGKNMLTYLAKGHGSAYLLTITAVLTITAYLKLSVLFLPSKRPVPAVKTQSFGAIHVSLLLLSLMILLGGVFALPIQHFITTLLLPLGSNEVYSSGYNAYHELAKTFVTLTFALFLTVLGCSTYARNLLAKIPASSAGFSNLFFGYALALTVLAFQLVR
ncbi:MAG: hypothetical protein EOM32_11300 [Spirochaetia bacterium]|nr:hypothetical protein [Spirochaetia bacterium]